MTKEGKNIDAEMTERDRSLVSQADRLEAQVAKVKHFDDWAIIAPALRCERNRAGD